MEAFLAAMIVAATPLLFAALGELVTERSGVLNLGVEGMMLVGAVCAFITALSTGSTALGAVAGAAAGVAMAGLFALVALGFSANQAAAGLALTIFGTGLSGLIGAGYVGVPLPKAQPLFPASWAEGIPYGRAILGHDAMVYLAVVLAILLWWFLARTRGGLKLRAVGDNADSGHALGLPVLWIRLLATLFGGAMAGLGGAYLSLAYTPMWGEGMTAGRGWIALALVVFATWRPLRVMVGAYLFGGVMILQLFVQGSGLQIDFPAQFLSSLPYWATIIVLVVISRNLSSIRLNSPASLGKPYRPDA